MDPDTASDLHVSVPVAVEGRVFGYARHKDAAVLADQVEALGRLGIPAVEVFTDLSGATGQLLGLDAVLAALQPGDGLVVTTADRLARTPHGMADVFARIDAAGAAFCPQGIVTSPELLRLFILFGHLQAPRPRRRRRGRS